MDGRETLSRMAHELGRMADWVDSYGDPDLAKELRVMADRVRIGASQPAPSPQ